MQFPRLTCLYAKNSKISPTQIPPPWRLQHLNFFTFKMSHYLKSLKICPGLHTCIHPIPHLRFTFRCNLSRVINLICSCSSSIFVLLVTNDDKPHHLYTCIHTY